MCSCSGGNRRADISCKECEQGLVYPLTETRFLQPLHKIGKGLDCGCWQGTCWVVQWLLGEEQKVIAQITPLTHDADRRLIEVPVLNPAGYFGHCWMISYTDGFNEDSYLVEAAAEDDAIEEWVMSEHGTPSHIPITDLKDYEIPSRSHHSEGNIQHSCSFAGDGTPFDSDNITIIELPQSGRWYNNLSAVMRRVVRYYGPSLPHDGLTPLTYANFGTCVVCGKDCHSIVVDACLCSSACFVDFAGNGEDESPSSSRSESSDSASREDEGFYDHDFPVYGGHD